MVIFNEDRTECVIMRDDDTIFVLDEDEICEIFGEIKRHDHDWAINSMVEKVMNKNGIDFNGNNVLRKILLDEAAEILDETIDNSSEINKIIREFIIKIVTELIVSKCNTYKKIME